MKKRLIFFIAIILILGTSIWYAFFHQAGRYSIDMAIPHDAVMTIRTPSFKEIYHKLSPNAIWQSLKKYPSFNEYHRNIELTDSLGNAHSTLRSLITDRPFAISMHILPNQKYNFLYVCDLQKMNVIQTFEELIPNLVKDYGIRIVKQDKNISQLIYDQHIFYYAFKNNLLIGSFSEQLVVASLKNCTLHANDKKIKYTDDITLDINHKEVGKWLATFFTSPESPSNLSLLDSTRLTFKLDDKEILLNGTTHPINDHSIVLNALSKTSGASSEIKKIAGDNTAAYISLCFHSFPELKEALLDDYRLHDPNAYTTYETSLQKINKFLKIDVFDLLTSWIGNEIALLKPGCEKEQQLQAIVLAIQSKDIDYAKDQLNYLSEQIRLHTPVKFKSIDYNGFEINYLSLKGFFRLFAGGMFDKLEKPYYTIIDDYVVFSNSPAVLTQMIKKYILKQTLANSEKYDQLMDQLDSRSNIYAYINMPNTYQYLYLSLQDKSRQELSQNKGAALSFEHIGLELIQNDGYFKTRIVAGHNENAPEEFEIKELNEEFENLADEVESGRYLPVIPDSIAISTLTDYTWTTENFIMKGRLKDGEPEGFWNIYTKQNQLIGQLPYKDSKPDGLLRLFYNDNKIRAEVSYNDGKIETFREFFQDGTLRTELEYKRGKRQGYAKFYYSTGHLLCEGKYKKGQRSGLWEYYKVTGETDKKIKF